jgi:hypothetical protein
MLKVEEFLGLQVNEANATKVVLIPEGEYTGLVAADGIGLADFKYKRGDREGQTGYRMTVRWELDDPDKALENAIGRKPVIVQSLMLDLTSEGGLDMSEGKNVQLGRLREAVGQNEDGKPWQPAMLIGQPARLLVKHRLDDKGEEQQEVTKVTRI